MQIIGHQKQQKFLKKSVKMNQLAHAYLFSGEEKLGKKTLALELVSLLFHEEIKSLNSHPDLIFIEPKKKEIQVSQIKDLIWRLSLKPSLAKVKVAIIDNAHLMNQKAQTSLLKTLEEPRGDVFLILISHNPQYLFATIISRLQVVKFNSVKKEEIENYLLASRIVAKNKVEEISKISLGRPGMALDLAFKNKKLEFFNQKMEEVRKISNSPLFFGFQYIKNLAEDLNEIGDTLDVWLYYYRNILLKDPTKKIKNIINSIQTTKFLIFNTNINPKLALEELIIKLN